MSEEKLLYTQNGVFKRKEIQEGLILKSTENGFTSLHADTTGLYNISYNGSAYTLEAVTAGAGERMNTTYFYTDDNGGRLQVGTAGTIPVFTNFNTFSALNIPTDNQRYMLKNGQFVVFSKTVKEQTNLASDKTGLIYGKNNTFKLLEEPDAAGNYFIKYNGSDFEFVAQPTKVNDVTGSIHNSGLLYNNANNFDVLTTKTSGKYYISFDTNGIPSLTAVPTSATETKIAKSLRYSGKSANINDVHDLSDLSVTGDTSITANKKYTIHVNFALAVENYESLLDCESATDVYLSMESNNGDSRMFYLTNPQPVHNIDTSLLISPLSSTSFNLYFSMNNSSSATFKLVGDIKVDIVEV